MSRGRPPSFNINEDDIIYLIKCGFTWVYIAKKLGCSLSTLQRWRRENQCPRPNIDDFTDNEIDIIVK